MARTKTCGDNSTDDECPLGYFGKDCRFQCHCSEGDNCDENGNCVENEINCAKGWYSDKCQHVDVAYNGKDYATDGDPETCSEDVNIKRIFLVLSRPVLFRSLRFVVMEDEAFVEEIDVSFVTTDGSDVICLNGTSLPETDNILTLYCYDVGMVTHVNIRWKAERSVCSVHVEGGRNLALNNPSVTSERKTVDGDLSTGPEDCWSKTGDADPTWHVEFEGAVYLYRVEITGRPDQVGKRMRGFTLDLYGNNGMVVFSHKDDPLVDAPENKFSIEVDSSLIITKAEIYFNASKVQAPELHICEFEAFGDCAVPFFGDTCDKVCPVNCGDEICDIEGHCHWCIEGFKGEHCDTVDNYTDFAFYDDLTTIPTVTTMTTAASTPAPDTEDVMDLVFLCLHLVFGTTIVSVVIAFVFLHIRDYKSTRGSTVYSLAPSTISGSLMSPKRSQKTLSIHHTDSPRNAPTLSASKTMTYTAQTTTNP